MPRLNAAGRVIWFVHDARGDGGTYRPVARQGRIAFALAIGWVLLCGSGGMAGFVATLDWRCFVAMFVVCAIGLAFFARAVIRHS